MKLFSIVLVIFISFSSCNQITAALEAEAEDPNLIRSYYKNGKLKSELRIDNDENRHGLTKQYYKSGILKSEIYYYHGSKDSAFQFYENGNRYLEFYYKNGIKHGIRKKYWENGNIQSILEYGDGNPKKGLKEFKKNGELVKKYPTLKIQQIDRLESYGQYIVEVYFSSNPQKGTYYLGELKDGFLTTIGAAQLKTANKRGRITYKPYPGSYMMKKINLIGKYKTAYGNIYIVEKSINIALDY